jgi:hypothetical protein
MKIKSFRVAGYKNLVKPVALDGLDKQSLIVIHGLNNVGKSNLLEALQLPFLLFKLTENPDHLPFVDASTLPEKLRELGHVPSEWFTLGKSTSIEVEVGVAFTDDALRRRGLSKKYREVTFGVRIDRSSWQITHFFVDGVDAAAAASYLVTGFDAPEEAGRYEQARMAEWRARAFINDFLATGFALLNLHRTSSDLRGRNILTDELALSLHDAKESTDPREYLRWSAFVRVCGEFGDVLGGAEPVVTYDRHRNLATLHMQSPAGRLPAHLLGTGVQQLLAIIGRMLVSKADVVAIEEPETSVSMGLHARVRDALQRMTETEDGLSQVFLTSHSPWFDGPEDFIAVVATDDGPAVQWRKANEVAKFTQSEMTPPPAKTAPLSYVTGEGYVALPLFVREHLGVEHGGGVVFNTAPEGRITMLSNQTALAEFGESDDDAE